MTSHLLQKGILKHVISCKLRASINSEPKNLIIEKKNKEKNSVAYNHCVKGKLPQFKALMCRKKTCYTDINILSC